jgi:hypothetical protein
VTGSHPNIQPHTADFYTPSRSGQLAVEEHLQLGSIIQYVTSTVGTHDRPPVPNHDLGHVLG